MNAGNTNAEFPGGKSTRIDMKATTFIFFGIVFAMVSCRERVKTGVKLEVGSYQITYEEVERAEEIAKFKYPHAKVSDGENKLVRAYQKAEILKKLGFEVSRNILEREAARIDAETLHPERLSQIKAMFGDDREAYLNAFVLPVYVERILPLEIFPYNKVIHASTFAKAKAFIASVQNGLSFESAAQQEGRSIAEIAVSDAGVVYDLSQNFLMGDDSEMAVSSEDGAIWLSEVVANLCPGEILPQPMEEAYRWQIAYYSGINSEGHHLIRFVSFPKKRYDEWLDEQTAAVSVQQY